MTKKYKTIRFNFLMSSMNQLMSIFIPLVTTPYLSRVLGPHQLGVFSYHNTIAYYFVMFSMLGVVNYGNRNIARVRDFGDKLSDEFWNIYALQFVSTIFFSLLYIIYALYFSQNWIISSIMFIYVFSSILDINWFFLGMEDIKTTVVRNILVKLFTASGIFIFIKSKKDLILYTIIYCLGILISQLFLWLSIKNNIKKPKWKNISISQHIKPNLILFIPLVAISLYKTMDKIMLGSIVSKIEVGYYESSERIIQVPLAFIISLSVVMLPRMSNLIVNNKKSDVKDYILKSFIFVAFLSSSMSFGIMSISKEFIPLFYGPGYEKSIILFHILLPSCMFLGFANVIRTQYLLPYKKDKIYIFSVLIGAVLNLFLNTLLIPQNGSIGAALGTLCAEMVVCLCQMLLVRKNLPIFKYLSLSFPFILSGVFVYLLNFNLFFNFSIFYTLLVKIFIGFCCYMICTFIILKYYVKKGIIKDISFLK